MSKARIGMVTVGQAPRGDVVPDMAALMPGVEILEAGALDGLDRAAIARLAPAGDDEILVTRLADASSVFVGKSHVLPRVKARIAALEDQGVALTVLLCTGAFPRMAARRPLLEPQQVLLGVLRGLSHPGRLGVLTPSERHVPLALRGARSGLARPCDGGVARGGGRSRRDGLHRLPRRHPAGPHRPARRPGARRESPGGAAGRGAAGALMSAGARLLLLLPFTALLGVFFAAPLALMVAISLSRQSFGELQWTFTLHHYARFFSDAYYIGVLWDTLVLGALVTVIALLLGYPLAYHLARTRSRAKPLLLVAVLSPLLVGIVIRCYGWMILLADRGLINATLVERGWLARPLPLMYNRFGVAVALVHVFLPFMVLSLTGVLKRIDPHALEAALTLGASPRRAFLEVTLPLSLPGILAGSLLVFSLAISSFVVPVLLGGFKVQVLPMIVYEQVLSVFDWPFGAANAFVLLVISIALIAVYIRVTERALRGIV